jgi:hypothetical protein
VQLRRENEKQERGEERTSVRRCRHGKVYGCAVRGGRMRKKNGKKKGRARGDIDTEKYIAVQFMGN